MPINRRLLVLSLATLLLAAGCRTMRHTAAPEPPVPARSPAVCSTARFSCTIEGTTVGGQLRMAEDSIIWGSAFKVVELGRAKITPDSVIVYAKVLGRCFCGTYDDLYNRYRFRTSYAEIQKMLTGDDPDAALTALARRFGTEAVFRLDPWQVVPTTTFPLAIPPNTKIEN